MTIKELLEAERNTIIAGDDTPLMWWTIAAIAVGMVIALIIF